MIISGLVEAKYGSTIVRVEMPAPKMRVKSIAAMQFAQFREDLFFDEFGRLSGTPAIMGVNNNSPQASANRAGSLTATVGIGSSPIFSMPVYGCFSGNTYKSRYRCDFESGRVLTLAYQNPAIVRPSFFDAGDKLYLSYTIECYE